MGRKWVGVQPRGPNHEDVRIARSFFETETEEGLRGLGQREGVGGADGFGIGAGIENFQREVSPAGEVGTGLGLVGDIANPCRALERDGKGRRIGGDARLVAAHEVAVTEALRELETYACHQDGRGINKRYVTSGQIAAAVFRHGESRALDPHLHSHAFVFNVVQSGSNSRLLALESSNIFERSRYLTEVYRNALAREVQKLGYAIERRAHGFELAEISSNLLERFSKRAAERDRAIAVREAELGRELTRDEIAEKAGLAKGLEALRPWVNHTKGGLTP